MDSFSKAKRSQIMSKIRAKNTRPEIIVRSLLHSLGFRFRLHRKDLPGKPDVVLPKYKIAIFVHGCFWHQHPNCKRASMPKSNVGYWKHKLLRNVERDASHAQALEQLGWKVVVVWECETKKPNLLIDILKERVLS